MLYLAQNLESFHFLIEKTRNDKERMIKKMMEYSKPASSSSIKPRKKLQMMQEYYKPMDKYEFSLIRVLKNRIKQVSIVRLIIDIRKIKEFSLFLHNILIRCRRLISHLQA